MAVAQDIIQSADKQDGVISILSNALVLTAAEKMRKKHIGCIIVRNDDGQVVGVLSERDIVGRVTSAMIDPSKTLVSDVMTTPVVSCTPTTSLENVRELMHELHIRHIVVLDDGEPVGMISSREILSQRLADDREVRNLAIFSLARLAETRDTDTGPHLERVREYARILANHLRSRDGFGDIIDESFVEGESDVHNAHTTE